MKKIIKENFIILLAVLAILISLIIIVFTNSMSVLFDFERLDASSVDASSDKQKVVLGSSIEAIYKDEKIKLKSNQKVTWSSSNTQVATVDDIGVVTGKNYGMTKITAKSSNGNTKIVTVYVGKKKEISKNYGPNALIDAFTSNNKSVDITVKDNNSINYILIKENGSDGKILNETYTTNSKQLKLKLTTLPASGTKAKYYMIVKDATGNSSSYTFTIKNKNGKYTQNNGPQLKTESVKLMEVNSNDYLFFKFYDVSGITKIQYSFDGKKYKSKSIDSEKYATLFTKLSEIPKTEDGIYNLYLRAFDKEDAVARNQQLKFRIKNTNIKSKNKITVTFNKNKATNIGTTSEECIINDSKSSCKIETPLIIDDGKVLGWSKNKDATDAEYKVDEKITVSKNTVLYAITKKIPATIIYDANGGIISNQKQVKTTNNGFITNLVPIRIGYEFLGWTSPTGNENYKSGDKYSSYENITLYAQWKDLYVDNNTYYQTYLTSSNNLLFNKINKDGIYNYAPTAIREDNGQIHIFYVANQESKTYVDHLVHRSIKKNNSTGYYYSQENILLTHSNNGWDSVQACDPTVIKGNFKYNNNTYKYLMVYLGTRTTNNSLNQIGLAVSNNLNSSFTRVSVSKPFIPYPSNSLWGVGQPSAINLDGKGKVLISYTQGLKSKTSQYFGIYDLSDLNNPKTIKSPVEIASKGSPSYISNADIAIDLVNDKIWITSHQGNTYEKNKITKTTNYIPSKSVVMSKKLNLKSYNSLIDAVYNSLKSSTNSWSGSTLSSNEYLIHNTGFIRDSYGYINGVKNIYDNLLISTATKNQNQDNQVWTYKIQKYK